MANDIILYFSGNAKGRGLPMTPKDGVTDDDIINKIHDIKGKNQVRLTGWTGTGGTGLLARPAIDFIIKNSPSEKLIIYGYSAGGMDALQLCQEIFRHREARDLVDLLITVDAATGTGIIPRHLLRVTPNVVFNLNFWTPNTSSMMSDSHGAENIPINPKMTTLRNKIEKESDHNTIRINTRDRCVQAIQNVLNGMAVE